MYIRSQTRIKLETMNVMPLDLDLMATPQTKGCTDEHNHLLNNINNYNIVQC